MAHESSRTTFTIPDQVIGIVEVKRLRRELEALEDALLQTQIRQKEKVEATTPKVSRLLNTMAETNQLNLIHVTDRHKLATWLHTLEKESYIIRISFATDPSAVFMEKIVSWFRNNVHKHVLISVGLEPAIAAGCVVRTPNKQFDFSIKRHFDGKHDELAKLLQTETGAPQV